jgi:hypothetical protein
LVIDLAKDPNVDLVVCSVRVDKHFAAIAPAVKAGKNVYVEWPLGKNLEEAEELLRLSKAHGVKQTVVGLQGRFAPSVRELKELLEQGRIGKVLSSTWVGYGGNGGPTEPESIRHMVDKSVGGNLVTIHFGHAVDFIQQGEGFCCIACNMLIMLQSWAYSTQLLASLRTDDRSFSYSTKTAQLLPRTSQRRSMTPFSFMA